MKRKKLKPRRRRPAQTSVEMASELFSQGKTLEGLRLLDGTINAGTATPMTWRLMGVGLVRLKEYAQAVGALETAVELDPKDAEAKFSLGDALFQLGDVACAVRWFEEVAREMDHENAWCNLATIIPGDPKSEVQTILDVRREFAQRLTDSQTDVISAPLPEREADSRVRVGFISAFFRNENYMKPVWELICRLDRSKFEVHLFADDVREGDFGWLGEDEDDRIHLTTELSNQQLVQAIRNETLDVLIDLNAYSVPNRLGIYVHRLADCVAAWFNMYASSGLPGIDWIIGDHVVAPPDEDHLYSERVARLPQSYLSFHVNYKTPDVVEPPVIANGYLTFGSLISQYKVTPQVYDAWSKILRQCPDARLKLGNRVLSSRCNRDYVLQAFNDRGIDTGRIECLPPAEHFDFLNYYSGIDVALDAFPYNGGTTTTEAIWQGVPVLAIDGDRWASRTSATLLKHCHLGEFVTDSVDQYIAQAVSLASGDDSIERLKELRANMQSELRNSDLCAVDSMVRSFEEVLLELKNKGPAAK